VRACHVRAPQPQQSSGTQCKVNNNNTRLPRLGTGQRAASTTSLTSERRRVRESDITHDRPSHTELPIQWCEPSGLTVHGFSPRHDVVGAGGREQRPCERWFAKPPVRRCVSPAKGHKSGSTGGRHSGVHDELTAMMSQQGTDGRNRRKGCFLWARQQLTASAGSMRLVFVWE
jgi:hypothetical protein